MKIEKKYQTDKYDSCFWMGDFNYRINLTNQEFQDFFKRKRFDVILFDNLNFIFLDSFKI